MKGTQTCVLRGKSSLTRDVDDQAKLARVFREFDVVTCDRRHRKIMHARHKASELC
jgi:hypothetical protein